MFYLFLAMCIFGGSKFILRWYFCRSRMDLDVLSIVGSSISICSLYLYLEALSVRENIIGIWSLHLYLGAVSVCGSFICVLKSVSLLLSLEGWKCGQSVPWLDIVFQNDLRFYKRTFFKQKTTTHARTLLFLLSQYCAQRKYAGFWHYNSVVIVQSSFCVTLSRVKRSVHCGAAEKFEMQ